MGFVRLSVLLMALLALSQLSSVAVADIKQLWFAYTGSIRGGVMPRASGAACSIADASISPASSNLCHGGCAQRQMFIEEFRETHSTANSVVLDTGSSWWGSLQSYATMAKCINNARYDIISLGYADMFAGTSDLAAFLTLINSTTDILSSNIDYQNDIKLSERRVPLSAAYPDGLVTPWVVRTIAGVEVVFVGLVPANAFTFPSTKGIAPTVETGLSDDFRIRINVFRARAAHPNADVVVVVSDLPPSDARRIAQEVDGINLFFHGDGEAFGVTRVTSLYDKTVYMATIDSNGETIGSFRLDWDTVAKTASIAINASNPSQNIITTLSASDDMSSVSATWNMMLNATSVIEEQYKSVIGSALLEHSDARGNASLPDYPSLTTIGCRNFDCALGRVVVDAYRRACLSLYNTLCNVAFINSGSLRAPLPAGEITMANVMSVLSFRNTVFVLRMTGEQLIAVLQTSIGLPNDGGFGQTNIVYARSRNTNLDIGQQLVDTRIAHPTTGVVGPLDSTAIYTVATNQFLYQGGNGYTMFEAALSNVATSVDTDLLIDHIRQNSPLAGASEEEMASCLQNEVPLETMAAQSCRVVLSNLTASEAALCNTHLDICLSPPTNFADLFHLSPNITQCNSCSGLGTCFLRLCTCAVPTEGPFKGLEVLRGAGCGEALQIWELSEGGRIAIYVLSAIALLVCITIGIMIFIKRNERAVRATSPNFGYLICLGGVCCSLAALLTVIPEDAVPCMAPMWLMVFGYVLMFGSLFIRTYRIHAIFNSQTLHALSKGAFSDFNLLKRLGLIALVNLAIMIVFQAMDPQYRRALMLTDVFEAQLKCQSDDTTFLIVLIVFNAALLVWGIYLVVRTRGVESNFNESSYIGLAVYNCTFVAIIALAIIFSLNERIPTGVKIVQAVAVIYVVIFTVLVVYIPRFFRLKQASDMPSEVTVTGGTSVNSLAPAEIMAFLGHIRKLEQELTSNSLPVPPRPPLPTAGGPRGAAPAASAANPAAATAGGQGGLQGSSSGAGGMFGRSNARYGSQPGSQMNAASQGSYVGSGGDDAAAAGMYGGGGGTAGDVEMAAMHQSTDQLGNSLYNSSSTYGNASGERDMSHSNMNTNNNANGSNSNNDSIYKSQPMGYEAMVSKYDQDKRASAAARAEHARQQEIEAERRAAVQAAAAASGGAGAGAGEGAGGAGGAGAVVNPYAQNGVGRGSTNNQRRLLSKPAGQTIGMRRDNTNL